MKSEIKDQGISSLLRKAKAFDVFRDIAILGTCIIGAFQLTHIFPQVASKLDLPNWFDHIASAALGVGIGAFAVKAKIGGEP